MTTCEGCNRTFLADATVRQREDDIIRCDTCEERHAAAVVLGRRGGRATSARKTTAVRENGKLGGRPRKER